jgi:tetratricopeptide (TPR) repeat protein
MDSRRTLALGLCVLTGSLGCTTLPERAPTDTAAVVQAEKQLPARQPQPATCVAFGDFHAQYAADPKCPPLERQSHQDAARRAYQQALDICPTDLAALTQIGWLYVSMNDRDHAVNAFQRAVQSHSEDASAWYHLGVCQAHYHEWTPALDNLRRAVELAPENRSAAHFYGYTLAHAGQFDESFMVFSRLEGDARAHYEVARMLHHMKQDEQSKSHLQKAIDLDPQLTPAREMLAALSGTGPAAPTLQVPEPDAVPPS